MAYEFPKLIHPKANCEGCLVLKQVRKTFPAHSNFIVKQVLELIHCDICGPITPETPAGNRYFLLLLDDYSRKMWVYMLKTKGEELKVFNGFKQMIENKTEEKIKILRSDRGGEFFSMEFKRFCEQTGTVCHYTDPYTPQQNGVVERRNRTFVAMARSCLKSMKLPSFLWGEAVRHSVYILNRLPTKSLSGRTPYEAWTSKKPDLKFVKVFWCTAFMKIPSVDTRKLDDRSKVVVNLGKEPGTKAYRLYDPKNGSVCVSRDVVFVENKAWTWENTDEG